MPDSRDLDLGFAWAAYRWADGQHLDRVLAGAEAAGTELSGGDFVRWARRQKLTRLDFAAVKWGGPTGVIDTETRWEQARWLLHEPFTRSAALRSCASDATL